ncbi:transposase [Lentibacillus sp. N15]|uniref:transposase n=1 Tax=Lentibacillus songyuanensis TaxID=3136161 RepID=UPI0031BA3862
MSNHNTFNQSIYTTKRSIFHFASKLAQGLQKPNKNFILDMLFGLAKGRSVLLTKIARALEEPIDAIQTVKRLSNRLDEFHETSELLENYEEMIKPFLQEEDNLILVDNSEIVKSTACKMEALGQVRDGSTGKIGNGYWTTNMIAVAPKTKHPISVYSHLYSSAEKGFVSENEETYKGLDYVNGIVKGKKATFVMDRGYDNIEVMKKVLKQENNFIIRLKKNRNLLYQNKKFSVHDLAIRRKGKINFRSEIKGTVYDLKVSHLTIEIPSLKGKKLTMVVVYGYGKEPMVLLTNKRVQKKEEVLSILKAYITRWRIEEMFRVQKQEFDLENVRVRTLPRLKRMFLLVSIMITFMTLKVEKKNGFFHDVIERAKGIKAKDQIKMFLYRFSAGMKAILEKDKHGIRHFKYIEKPVGSRQLALQL